MFPNYQDYTYPPLSNHYMQKALGYGGYQQQPFQPMPQTICLTVGSIEEARAARMDNLANTYVFTDFNNNKVYVKKIDSNGNPALRVYAEEVPPPATNEDKITLLEKRLAELEAKNTKTELPPLSSVVTAPVAPAPAYQGVPNA